MKNHLLCCLILSGLRRREAITCGCEGGAIEGFGLPVLEAMACGVPVLCSTAPSLLEVAGDAALTAPLDQDDERANIDALADGLNRLVHDAALRVALIDHGITRAASFSWSRAAEETVAAYEQATT